MFKIAEAVAALKAVLAEIDHHGNPLLEERLAALEAALKALVAEIAAEIAGEISQNGGSPLDERVAALEAVVGIGDNGGPPLDNDEPPKRKPSLLPDRQVAQRYGVSVRSLERWDKISDLNFPPPIYIRRRRYRNIAMLDVWDHDNAGRVVSPLHRGDLAKTLSRPRAQRGRFTKPRDTAQQDAKRRARR